MFASRSVRLLSLASSIGIFVTSAAHAQRSRSDWQSQCERGGGGSSDDRRRERECEVREVTIAAPSRALRVDGGQNGGVEVNGESRRDVRIEARMSAEAESRDEARRILSQIKIETDGDVIRASGPERGRDASWYVSFVISAPRQTDLDLRAYNGGVAVNDVTGRMELATHNGGLHLSNVGGDVRGETQNGGVHVELDGDRWEGQGLDLRTQNGGVHVELPSRYAAHLETGTTNGGMSIDFPVTVQGRIGRRIETDLNGGGKTIRVITTNGGVNIVRR
jgi:hypothetical protein